MKMRWFLMLLPCLLSAPVLGDDWYVSSGGSGDGSMANPFGAIQDGLDAAQQGDTVLVAAGTYQESLATQRDGTALLPIRLRSGGDGPVIVTVSGRVLRVDHAHFQVSGLIFDGQYGDRDTLDINDGADGLVVDNCEVRRSTRDCIDMGAPGDVLIDNSEIHHCLNAAGGRTDAHGITGGAVHNLTIRNTRVHTFSGDAVQFDPGRDSPGWDNIVIEGCRFWLEPLPQDQNGFGAGTVPGENAIDTKTYADGTRSTLIIRDTTVHGFGGGLINNMAAFNLKEEIDARLDRITVYDSEIAFRLRGQGSRPGAWVRITNAVIYNVEKAVRYEDDIDANRMFLQNSTIGSNVTTAFQRASAPQDIMVVQNLLLLAASLPSEASASSNLAVDHFAFVDASNHKYRLVLGSPAANSGETIADITVDRDGVPRPQELAYDIGAYEFVPAGTDAGLADANAATSDGNVATSDGNVATTDGNVATTDASVAADVGSGADVVAVVDAAAADGSQPMGDATVAAADAGSGNKDAGEKTTSGGCDCAAAVDYHRWWLAAAAVFLLRRRGWR